MEVQDNLVSYIEQSLKHNWELLALTDFKGQSFQYRDVARKVAKLHLLFENADLRPGDKIALCGRNSAQWAIAALASASNANAGPMTHTTFPPCSFS